ncbi:hypothetical protein LJK88_20225 [Paenibacillus sp. P26]|nr:hypothetical protein LJK88_20225 [Paenibacillus sp. P26]
MQAYHEALAGHGIGVGQILLTRSDFSNRKRITNAQMTIEESAAPRHAADHQRERYGRRG